MPSKLYKKRLARKERHSANSETDKSQSSEYYEKHKATIISYNTEKLSNDKTWQKNHSHLMMNSEYQERNRQRAKKNVKAKLSEDEYRAENRQRSRNYIRHKRAVDQDFYRRDNSRLAESKRQRLNEHQTYRDRHRQRIRTRVSKTRATNKLSTDRNRQKTNERVKKRLTVDKEYRESNRMRARINTKKRLAEDEEYRELNRMRARINTEKRLAEDEEYRELNRIRATINKKKRLAVDEEYRESNRIRATINTKKRLAVDEEYRESNRMRARINTARRLQTDTRYKAENNNRARVRISKISKNASFKVYQRRLKAKARQSKQRNQDNEAAAPAKRVQRVRTKQQKYWIRRSRLITASRRQHRIGDLKRKMMSHSNKRMLDVDLLFAKAQKTKSRGLARLKGLHSHLVAKTTAYLEEFPPDRQPDEETLTAALDGRRFHTSHSELYFWEHSYKVAKLNDSIPVDSSGKAHVFKSIVAEPASTTSAPAEALEAVTDVIDNSTVERWECHPELCLVDQQLITDTVSLFSTIYKTRFSNCMNFYLTIDKCNNPARSQCLGHTLFCPLSGECQSLLRPVRILACHFPALRSLVNRLYEVRRLAIAIHAVDLSMASAKYHDLEYATNLLQERSQQTERVSTCDNYNDVCRPPVDETAVVDRFGKALREVVDIRDTYATSACDVCDQLRNDLRTLQSYEGTKGFTSKKMTELIDLLYQQKTQYHDIDQFLQSMLICKYCADRLRSNKDVARCAFNKLFVVDTPECIKSLNIFERSLIKHYLSCITVVRLGQISNTARPQNELNSALKGRIAHLPLDLSSNAAFVPHGILNTDGLVLLVGGQPTKSKKIWTSVVDLRKVHEALTWLRVNNPLYKEVPAYSIDEMKNIIEERLRNTSDHNRNCDDVLLKKLDQAAKSHLYESFTIQPISSEFPADMMIDYQLDKVNSQSENFFESDLDLKVFPELFPTGENGMRDATRKVRIGTSDYLKTRLLNKDPKFRLSINYLFHSFQIQEMSYMCHSVGHMLRCVTGREMTAQQFYHRLKEKDGETQSKMFALMANLRGSKEYFSKLSMEIKWMMRSLGPPTLFVTCSTAEWFSEAFIRYLREINATVPGVNDMTPAELCCMDPVSVSVHFHKKWSAIFTKLIKSKETPLFGEVSDHFWRIEYQARGAPHVHVALWVKDAPVIGQNTPEEVRSYIDKIATCSIPDGKQSPSLNELVMKFQSHKCNRYCKKIFKQNDRFFQKCRFGFPRPVEMETKINDVVDCLAVNRSARQRKRLYHLQRTDAETRINDYNPALLLANQANVDVQYIGHTGSRLPYYITDYMTKHERCEQDSLWNDIFTSTKSLGSNAMSFMLKTVKSRQVGSNEAADRLLGNKLYSKSRQTRFADLQRPDMVKRILKPCKDIEQLLKNDPESTDIFHQHWVLDVYPNRPDQMEDTSLHDTLAWYEKVCTGNEEMRLRDGNTFLRKRTSKPYIITHQLTNPNKSHDSQETYFYHLLKLFKPWRNESDICPVGHSYSEHFSDISNQYPDMTKYHEDYVRFEAKAQEADDAVKKRAQELSKDVECVDHDDEHSAFDGAVLHNAETAMHEVLQAHRCTVNSCGLENSDDIDTSYQTLNADQKRVVDKITDSVCNSDRAIHLVVSGQGGTGKSRVISVLSRIVSAKFSSHKIPVAVTAPTGLAAFNVSGTTIHRLLSLPVEHGKPPDYYRLNQDTLNVLRNVLQGLKLLVIDESSMLSSLTLMYIHLRLTEIMSSDAIFGGISVVLFGDFLQLPPVKGNQPFQTVSLLEAKQRIGCIASMDLWRNFQYDELTENVRQSGDQLYSSLLSHIRVGKLSTEEEQTLRKRMIAGGDSRASVDEICTKYRDLEAERKEPIMLVPRTCQCDELNTAMLHQMNQTVYDLTAIDTLDTVVKPNHMAKVKKAYEKVKDDVTRTAGLERSLQLCVQAKVMLKRNRSVEEGLINGSVGFVTGFVSQNNKVSSVEVQFNKVPGTVKIDRESSSFEILKGIFYTRKQFPLMLAFAITVHKCQGLSLQSAIVDAGSTCFGPGMIYVALSRVTSLSGLHLIDLQKSKIQCDKAALREYNRLRQLYTPHLEQLPVPNESRKRSMPRTNDDAQTLVEAGHTLPKTADSLPPRHAGTPAENQLAISIFNHCSVYSVGSTFQMTTCSQLNLRLSPDDISRHPRSSPAVARKMAADIFKHTHTRVAVSIHRVSGIDGNCLFRALSLGITGTEDQHDLLRSYVVNHMLDNTIRHHLRNIYTGSDAEFDTHLLGMQDSGQWGTDCEIAASAHMLGLSVVCYSKYDAVGHYRFQHFSPHFIHSTDCTNDCQHETLYLVNTSGVHYDLATVTQLPTTEE